MLEQTRRLRLYSISWIIGGAPLSATLAFMYIEPLGKLEQDSHIPEWLCSEAFQVPYFGGLSLLVGVLYRSRAKKIETAKR